MRLMSKKASETMGDVYPCDQVMDIAVSYRWLREQEDGVRISEPVKNEELKEAELTREELLALARKNTEKLFKTRLFRMEELVDQICGGEGAKDMMKGTEPLDDREIYVCTNDSGIFGASVMLMPKIMKKIAGRLGMDFYILPSSIHEVIIVPALDTYDKETLKETVETVNKTVLEECDFLSDQVYLYDSKTETLKEAV